MPETGEQKRQRIAENLRRLKAAQRPREEIERYLASEQGSAADALFGMEKLEAFGKTAGDAATFGVSGLIEDALKAIGDGTFQEARDERKAIKRRLGGGAALAASLIGGAASPLGFLRTGGALLRAAKDGSGLLRASGRAAVEGGLQGGLSGFGENVGSSDSPTGLMGAMQGGLGGLAAGGVLGGVAGGIARRGARNTGITPEGRSMARQITSANRGAVDDAVRAVDEFASAGKGDVVMAADVLGPEAAGLTRNAMNVSPQGRALATSRIRTRDAGVGPRAAADLGESVGMSADDVALATDDIIKARAAKAAPLYARALEEATAFDDLYRTMTRGGPPRAFTQKLKVAMADPDIQDAIAAVRTGPTDRTVLRGRPERHEVLDAAYKELGKDYRAAQQKMRQNPDAESRRRLRGLTVAREKLRAAIVERAPTYKKALSEFADDSEALNAYESGADIFNRPLGEVKLAAQDAGGDRQMLVKGALDRTVQDIRRRAGNPDLGAGARGGERVGQHAIGSQEGGEVWKELAGPKGYGELVKRAGQENAMSRTSRAAQGGSTTAAQVSDIGDFTGVLKAAGAAISINPKWFATMLGRNLAGAEAGKLSRFFKSAEGARVADAMTRMGKNEVKEVLRNVLLTFDESTAKSDAGKRAAQATGGIFGRAIGALSAR